MEQNITIGMDLGDKKHVACVLDAAGNEILLADIPNTSSGLQDFVRPYAGAVIVIEACTHSPWISWRLCELGYTVYVGNPRKLRCIWNADDKTDQRDARMLARVGRLDPSLLSPITHRRASAQSDLQIIKARDALVGTRTGLVNFVRSSVKGTGGRLPSGWGTDAFGTKAVAEIPETQREALLPVLETIRDLTSRIHGYDRVIQQLAKERYPVTAALQQVKGVGPLTALAFVLTIDDPRRFKKSRDIGPYLGLTPKRDQSGETDKQLHITKAGDSYLRRLLVNCAQYILGPFGEDSQLRRKGTQKIRYGGKIAKNKAVVALARKLAIVLHRLWVSGETYEPFYGEKDLAKMSG